MYDDELTQARQALGDGRWEEARSLYASFSPQKVAEARPALLLIDLHDAKEAKDSKNAEIIAGKLSACLEKFDEFPDDFVRAFCPQVLPSLLPNVKTFKLARKKDIHVHQWLLAIIASSILVSYCLADEMNSLPEPEQNRIRMAAVALFEYTKVGTGSYNVKRSLFDVEDQNRYADPESFKRFSHYRYDIIGRIRLIYKALGADDISFPISPEARKEYSGEIMSKLIAILAIILFCLAGALLTSR